jgi:hypothetical protein
MSDIHFFSHPKPWLPEFDGIQRSAVKSWKSLSPTSITLLGTDQGTAEAAKDLDVSHIPNVKQNEWGTPLVSSIFDIIRQTTNGHSIVCYINTDIILDQSFLKTVQALYNQSVGTQWLGVGKRTDIDLSATITDIVKLAKQHGRDHGWAGIDYFIFPPNTFQFVYPFALGKFVWDQWLVGNAFRRGLWTVDCSDTLLAIHQNCPWYQNGKSTHDRKSIQDSKEGVRNRSFDYYQKTILSGTTHKTQIDDNGDIRITKKTLVPD